MSAGKSARKAEMIYKTTDFRRELAYREKKVAEIKREKMKILADIRPVPKFMVTLDLSHARGNMDALRICLKELEWKEVWLFCSVLYLQLTLKAPPIICSRRQFQILPLFQK